MTRDPKYDVLFEPVRIGPRTLRNRFYQTPHCTGFGEVFPGAQAHLRAIKAEGGWAAVTSEATTISPEYDSAGLIVPSRFWDETDVPNWRLMVERVHEQDALAGIELHTGGSLVSSFDSRLPARHITPTLEEPSWMGAVIELDKQGIRDIQQQYVDAAHRSLRAGFDIVNVHGAESASLPVLFLMNHFNKRTDEYGGSFENRARFWLETLEMVREVVDGKAALTARLTLDSLHGDDQGIRVEEEGVGFIELADHLVDFWDLQVGGRNTTEWMRDAGPSRFYEENFQAKWVSKARPHTEKPIVGVGRFTNPDTMVAVIESGQLDIIGAARPSIADPFLPKKIEEGRLDEIRECIGCNLCVSRVGAGWRLVCTQNATSGEEYRRGWHPERFSKARNSDLNVLVVGGGPAGMECAIGLGKRGMESVHLVEAGEEAGGHLRWVSRLPGMAAWGRVIDYRKIQLQKLKNVETILGTELSASDVLEYGADLVVLATGARWATDGLNAATNEPIPGADASQDHVLTPEQIIIEGKPLPGERVLIYDCEGYFMGVSLAQKLATEGSRVTLVTPMAGPGMYMNFTGESIDMIPMLRDLAVEMIPGHQVLEVSGGEVRGLAPASGVEVAWQTDAVLMLTTRMPDERLYGELRADPERLEAEEIQGLYRVGDGLSPRMAVADAIFDGHRLAREIDSDNPAVALPYIRENRVIGLDDAGYDAIIGREGEGPGPSSVIEGL